MRASNREAPDPYGMSILDMMTCALGACILIFVLRLTIDTGVINDLEQRRTEAMEDRDRIEHLLSVSTDRLREAEVAVQTGAKGAFFGLPPIRGRMSYWRELAEGPYRTLAESIGDAIERSPGVTGRLSSDGALVHTYVDMVSNSMKWVAESSHGGTVLQIARPGLRPAGRDELMQIMSETYAAMTVEERARPMSFHTIWFVLPEHLDREHTRQAAINSTLVSHELEGVFLVIPIGAR